MELHDVYTSDKAPKVLWDICCERELEKNVNISFKMPTWEEHLEFIKSVPYAWWELIFEDFYRGYVSLTHQNEIGIVLFKHSRGKGIGKRALKMFMDSHGPLPARPSFRPGHFVANINPENRRSQKLFASLGFELKQLTFVKNEYEKA